MADGESDPDESILLFDDGGDAPELFGDLLQEERESRERQGLGWIAKGWSLGIAGQAPNEEAPDVNMEEEGNSKEEKSEGVADAVAEAGFAL